MLTGNGLRQEKVLLVFDLSLVWVPEFLPRLVHIKTQTPNNPQTFFSTQEY